MRPYAVWELAGLGSDGCADMEGAAYDPSTGRLYVTQSYGEEPHVHVFQITLPEPVSRDGDIDADGRADAVDAVVLAQVLTDNIPAGTPPCVRPLACDFDLDGVLGAGDLARLAHYLAGNDVD